MVANAGIAPVGPLLDLTEEVYDKILAVNLKGVLFCYQAAARQMIKQGEGGRIIGLCETATRLADTSGMLHCRTEGIPWLWCLLLHVGRRRGPLLTNSKFAVRGLNQTFALELGKHKINCNVYCPSPVDTQMWTKIDETLTAAIGQPVGAITSQVCCVDEDVGSLGRKWQAPRWEDWSIGMMWLLLSPSLLGPTRHSSRARACWSLEQRLYSRRKR